MKNLAFIDGQNLHLGMNTSNWKVDFSKFRRYLLEKYNVSEAYYFMGYVSEDLNELYRNLQKAGFIIIFKEHSSSLMGKKKGNVDSDVIFEIMRTLLEEDFNKIVLVSGDGDYKKVVDYLIKKDKFAKILFPNRKYRSSLYKQMGGEFAQYLDDKDTKVKFEFTK